MIYIKIDTRTCAHTYTHTPLSKCLKRGIEQPVLHLVEDAAHVLGALLLGLREVGPHVPVRFQDDVVVTVHGARDRRAEGRAGCPPREQYPRLHRVCVCVCVCIHV
jgi:hypothetical protein